MRTALLACTLVLGSLLVQDPEKKPGPQPEVGKLAPSFRLNDHDGKGVGVGGLSAEWTVVAFFPKAATPG